MRWKSDEALAAKLDLSTADLRTQLEAAHLKLLKAARQTGSAWTRRQGLNGVDGAHGQWACVHRSCF